MKTVLVIEDDQLQQKLMVEKISASGFNVITASDGTTGLQAALDNQPDIILLDNRMPSMSGYEMLRRLRETGSWGEQVPVIFFSNIEPASKDERSDLEAVQPTAYLLKSDSDLGSIVDKITETIGVAN